MIVRRATLADIPAVQALSEALFKDPTSASDTFSDHAWAKDERGRKTFSDAATKSDQALWVAEDGDDIIGYLSAGPAEFMDWRPIRRVELFSFYVSPDYRSQGVGRQLCEAFFVWAREQKAVTAMVASYADNERGIAFYKKMGFRPETLQLEIEL